MFAVKVFIFGTVALNSSRRGIKQPNFHGMADTGRRLKIITIEEIEKQK